MISVCEENNRIQQNTMDSAENVTVFPTTDTACPNCTNGSGYPEVGVAKAVVFGMLLVVFVVFGVLGNILVILSVLIHRHWRSVSHYFIANLAVADLLLSSAVLPFSATSEALGRWVFGRSFCVVWAALDVLCCTASILSLCVISVDRYLAVSYPLRYPAMATGRRTLTAVALLWGLSAAISVGPLLGWKKADPEDDNVCQINEDPGYALFSALCSFYIPLAVILAMYCRVYTVAKRRASSKANGKGGVAGVETGGVVLRIHRGNTAAQMAAKQQQEEEGGGGGEGITRARATVRSLPRLLKFSREEKAAKTLGIVVGVFILCWLPFFLVLPIGSIFPSWKPSDTVFKIAFWLGYLNSCINPVIYPCSSREFKRAFINVLRFRCLRAGGLAGGSKPQGPYSSSSSSSNKRGLKSSRASWSCCGALSTSQASIAGGPDQAAPGGAQIQRSSLLKAWCFSASRPPVPQRVSPEGQGSTRVLRLSIGVDGDTV